MFYAVLLKDRSVIRRFVLFFSCKKCNKFIPQVSQVFYEDCLEHALRVKVDLGEFPMDPIFQV